MTKPKQTKTNGRRWINTLLAYDFTGKLVEVQGFWYDGPVLEAGGPPFLEQIDWAFYDDGTEAGSTLVSGHTKNNNPVKGALLVDTIYLYRAGVLESSGNGTMNFTCQLQYNKNTTGWNDVNGSSANIQSVATGNIADGDDTTQRMTSFSHDSTNEGFDEVDGLAGGNSADLSGTGFEALFAIQIIGADVSENDTIVLKVVDSGGGDFDDYSQTDPTITVPGAGAQTYNEEAQLDAEADQSQSAAGSVYDTPAHQFDMQADQAETAVLVLEAATQEDGQASIGTPIGGLVQEGLHQFDSLADQTEAAENVMEVAHQFDTSGAQAESAAGSVYAPVHQFDSSADQSVLAANVLEESHQFDSISTMPAPIGGLLQLGSIDLDALAAQSEVGELEFNRSLDLDAQADDSPSALMVHEPSHQFDAEGSLALAAENVAEVALQFDSTGAQAESGGLEQLGSVQFDAQGTLVETELVDFNPAVQLDMQSTQTEQALMDMLEALQFDIQSSQAESYVYVPGSGGSFDEEVTLDQVTGDLAFTQFNARAGTVDLPHLATFFLDSDLVQFDAFQFDSESDLSAVLGLGLNLSAADLDAQSAQSEAAFVGHFKAVPGIDGEATVAPAAGLDFNPQVALETSGALTLGTQMNLLASAAFGAEAQVVPAVVGDFLRALTLAGLVGTDEAGRLISTFNEDFTITGFAGLIFGGEKFFNDRGDGQSPSYGDKSGGHDPGYEDVIGTQDPEDTDV